MSAHHQLATLSRRRRGLPFAVCSAKRCLSHNGRAALKWMIQAGLWKDRDARRLRAYQPRYRRDCRGELIQIDGSKHWWFEDRGPQCTLLVYIDDATSELMHPRYSGAIQRAE